jgi:hypothetical protein
MGNEFAVWTEAQRVLTGRELITSYTRQKLLAMSLLKEDRDPFSTAMVILNCDGRTAKRFAERVRSEGVQSAYHGNLGRRRYVQAFEMLKGVLADRRTGRVLVPKKFCEWIESEGVPVPSVRTVRYWLRNGFGMKRRRTHRRRSNKEA